MESGEGGKMKTIKLKTSFNKQKIVEVIASIILVFVCILGFMTFLCFIHRDLSIPTIVAAIEISGLLTGFMVCMVAIRTWLFKQMGWER